MFSCINILRAIVEPIVMTQLINKLSTKAENLGLNQFTIESAAFLSTLGYKGVEESLSDKFGEMTENAIERLTEESEDEATLLSNATGYIVGF